MEFGSPRPGSVDGRHAPSGPCQACAGGSQTTRLVATRVRGQVPATLAGPSRAVRVRRLGSGPKAASCESSPSSAPLGSPARRRLHGGGLRPRPGVERQAGAVAASVTDFSAVHYNPRGSSSPRRPRWASAHRAGSGCGSRGARRPQDQLGPLVGGRAPLPSAGSSRTARLRVRALRADDHAAAHHLALPAGALLPLFDNRSQR